MLPQGINVGIGFGELHFAPAVTDEIVIIPSNEVRGVRVRNQLSRQFFKK